MRTPFLLFVNFLLMFWNANAFALGFEAQPMVFNTSTEARFMGKHLYLTRFESSSATPEEAWQRIQQGSFFQVDQDRPNYGLSRDTFFGYFEIFNPATQTQTVILENNFAMADYFHVYAMNASGGFEEVFVGGDQVDITKRHVINRTMNTQLLLQPGVNRFMLKAYGETCLQIPIRLWKEGAYRDQIFKEYLVLGFLVGIHVVMILYNGFLGLTLKDKVYFYYVIFVLCNVVYHVSNFNLGQYLGYVLFGSKVYSNHIQLVAVDGIIISSILFSKRFLNFYKPEYPLLNTILSINVATSVFNMFINNQISAWITSIMTLLSASVCVSMLLFIGFLKLRARFQPAQYFMLGWTAYLLGSGGIIAVNLGLLEATDYNYWAQFVGGAIEVSLFSLALGSRINFIKKQNHERIKTLNAELQSLNTNLERQVEERTKDIREILKHLRQGIFTLRSSKAIDSEYSKFLETIFADKDLGGKDIVSLLKNRSNLSDDDLNRLANAIDFSIHEDESSLSMNKDCFPDAITFRASDGVERYLEFDWVGISHESLTQKILVSVWDTTEKRQLTKQISEKTEELKYISELIEIKAERFNQFEKVSSELLQEAEMILSTQPVNHIAIRNLLINYHTLKGLTRTLGLSDLSNALHHAESELSQANDKLDSERIQQIRSSLQKIRAIFDNYKKVNNEKLGRFVDPNFNLVPKVLIENLLRDIEEPGALGPRISRDVSQLKTFYYKLLDDIIFGHMNSVKSICDQLDKPMPKFKFINSRFGLAPRAAEAIDLAAIQLIRNSLDHGIEKPNLRLEKGKHERGCVEFRLSENHNCLEIRITDDGQGLSLSRIKDVAVAKGKIEESCQDFTKIAQQIFEPSISTKSEISNISGRGIGLEAAKTALKQVGGDLSVCLLEEADFSHGCRFEFIIVLPKEQYCHIDAEPTGSMHVAA
jgi:HPt (histidine-containing phosphotransfer) domain-containing protein